MPSNLHAYLPHAGIAQVPAPLPDETPTDKLTWIVPGTITTMVCFNGKIQKLIIKGTAGVGGNGVVFRVEKLLSTATSNSSSPSSSSRPSSSEQPSSSSEHGEVAAFSIHPDDLALKVCFVHKNYSRCMAVTMHEFTHANHVPAAKRQHIVVPEQVGYLGVESDGRKWPCLLMELAPHGSLVDVINPPGQPAKGLSVEETAYFLSGVLNGLDTLHWAGVVHRDLKAHNILLFGPEENPVPKISDFGSSGVFSLNESCRIIGGGTPGFRPFEMLAGLHQDGSVDVYQLGLMLLQLRWGKMPFWYLMPEDGDTPEEQEEHMKRASDPAAELEDDRCLYTKAQPGGPEPLNNIEVHFLFQCLERESIKRMRAGDLLKHRYIPKAG